jgi:hypothetical protein
MVFKDDLMTGGVNGMESYFVAQVTTEEVRLLLEYVAQGFIGIDMHCSRASKETESAEHANESEAMVTMQMRDKDVTQLGERQTSLAHLYLCAFTTVDHVQFTPALNHLNGGKVSQRWQSTAASQYMQTEWLHYIPISSSEPSSRSIPRSL